MGTITLFICQLQASRGTTIKQSWMAEQRWRNYVSSMPPGKY
jgi:hypothetical protein